MGTLTVAELIEALHSIGRIYRNEDGTRPAEALRMVIEQLDGAPDMTVAEWVAAKQLGQARSQLEHGTAVDLDAVLSSLEQARTHTALGEAIARLSLDARDWMALADKLTGDAGDSAEAAREAVHTCLSDRLLLEERIASVKRQFSDLTPPRSQRA